LARGSGRHRIPDYGRPEAYNPFRCLGKGLGQEAAVGTPNRPQPLPEREVSRMRTIFPGARLCDLQPGPGSLMSGTRLSITGADRFRQTSASSEA